MSNLPKTPENNEQFLNDIQSLQDAEQKLFSYLETNPNLKSDEQKKIIEKINQLSKMRMNLYKTMGDMTNFFQNALKTSVGTLRDQVIAISIVENQLNFSKKLLASLEQEKNNKIRLVEINTYYGDKYAEHSDLMKIIIFTLIPIIIVVVLSNKGIISSQIMTVLTIIISFIGVGFFWKKFSSIITRDNMNYQTYNWAFDPESAASSTSTTSEDPWAGNFNYGTCVGDACCSDGQVYDASMNQCVLATTTTTTSTDTSTESFVNNVLTKTQPGKYKTDVDLREKFSPLM